MSGLLSSFFIEPVVRHARRLQASGLPIDDRDSNSINVTGSDKEGSQGISACQCASQPHISISNSSSGSSRASCAAAPPPANPARPPKRLSSHVSESTAPLDALDHSRPTIPSLSSSSYAASQCDSTSASSPCSSSSLTPTASPRLADNNGFLGQVAFDRFVPLTSSPSARSGVGPLPVPPPNPAQSDGTLATHSVARPSAGQNYPLPETHHRQIALPATMSNTSSTAQTSPGGGSPTRSRSGLPIRTRRHSARNLSLEDTFRPSSLPEDDGKSLLRRRIHAIRDLQTSSDEKARRMHDIMNEAWRASKIHLRPTSPESIKTPERPCSSSSLLSANSTNPTTPGSLLLFAPAFDSSNPYNVHPPDLLPSFRPPPTDTAELAPASPDDESGPPEPELGCIHYKRNVKVQCYDCRTWYPCRHCHDAVQTTHTLNRHATENMLCMICQTPQPAAQQCKECGVRAAWYYCDTCKLWEDDATKRVYHCSDCGICRRGEGLGKDFVHCKKCNVCISIQYVDRHRCIERATECDCPICGEYMFHSSSAIVSMPCGHYLHHTCYNAYMADAYQCPVCKKSAKNMQLQWRKLDVEIERQPMPIQWRGTMVEIRCNDCGLKSRVGYHWLGNKCALCDGYNTVEVQILGREEDAAMRAQEARAAELRSSFERRRVQTFVPQALARSYFQNHEDEEGAERPRSAGPNGEPGFGFGSTAFEVLARMSRSLSPIRHYFDSDTEDSSRQGPHNTGETDEDESSGWGDYVDGEDDDEDADDDEETDYESAAEDDADDDDDDARGLHLELIGHR